jgi:glycosyltransferase involved in cell wall biosynthesis
MKQISVIIPCHNVENMIDRLAESLVRQTIGLDALELIFVDDASTDGTLQHLLEWEKRYEEHVMIIHCEQSGGPGAARNIGMEAATCEYISFIDSDDWVTLNYFERMFTIALDRNCDMVLCRYDRPTKFDGFDRAKEKSVNYFSLEQEDDRKQFLLRFDTRTSVWCSIYKKSVIEGAEIRFPEHTHYEDTYFSYLVDFYVKSVAACDDVLYHYYYNVQGIVKHDNEGERLERLITTRMFFDQTVKRNLFERYSKEIEYLMIQKYYCEVLEMMMAAFESMDYIVFCGIRDWMLRYFPDCYHNPYLNDDEGTVFRLLLKIMEQAQNAAMLEKIGAVFMEKVYKKHGFGGVCKKDNRETPFLRKDEMLMLVSQLDELSSEKDYEYVAQAFKLIPLIPEEDLLNYCEEHRGEMLDTEIYRYYIDREMIFAYMNDCIEKEPLSVQSIVYKQLLSAM